MHGTLRFFPPFSFALTANSPSLYIASEAEDFRSTHAGCDGEEHNHSQTTERLEGVRTLAIV